MPRVLRERFSDFVVRAQSHLRQRADTEVMRLKVGGVTDVVLPVLVDQLERCEEYISLVKQTRSEFAGDFHLDVAEEAWADFIHNYFCQSGFYPDLIEGETLDEELLFASYCSTFTRRESRTRYLAPMEFVSFARGAMDFGTFKIVRLSKSELDNILRQRVKRVFYPKAAFTAEEMHLLSQYWFLDVIEVREARRIGIHELTLSASEKLLFQGRTDREYTTYAKPVENAVRELCLFDWIGWGDRPDLLSITGKEKRSGLLWKKFSIPFVIVIEDEEISEPSSVPDTTALELDPFNEALAGMKVPHVVVDLNKTRTHEFVRCVRKLRKVIDILGPSMACYDWLDVGLGYFAKAFLAPPTLDQLLWYITALEALLGESGAGVSRRLAQRVGSIMGSDEAQKAKFVKRFEDLYSLRNSLVHGGRLKKTAHSSYWLDAYSFTRQAILWFLHMLHAVAAAASEHKQEDILPQLTREDILTFLDLGIHGRRRLLWLTNSIAENFPHMGDQALG